MTDSGVGHPGFVERHDLWDESQRDAARDIEQHLDALDFVRVAYSDPHGLARSKTLPASVFASALRNGLDFSAGPFVFDTGHNVAIDFLGDSGLGLDELRGAGDFILVPDPHTFQHLPGTDSRTAWVIGSEFLRSGEPHPLSSRQVLRQTVGCFAAMDLVPVIGLEVEWYLTRLLPGPVGNVGNGFGAQGAAPIVEATNAGYQFNLDCAYDTVAPELESIARTLLQMGLPLRSMEHESGPGQIETTFSPLHAMDAADAMLLFRTRVKQECRRRGFHASFMTLPQLSGFDPSGWHLHQSVYHALSRRNVFCDDQGYGLSETGQAYVAGLLRATAELCLLSIPTVNGYRRTLPQFSLAPTAVDWRVEDRSALVRVLPGGAATHVENRIGEPCANPYLAIAAQLHAGLEGIRHASLSDDLPASPLPRTLGESLRAFTASGRATTLLGETLKACLIKLKTSENTRFVQYCTSASLSTTELPDDVTKWEQQEYFRDY